MMSEYFAERTNTHFLMEYPALSNSLLGYNDGARMGTFLHECPDQRTQITLLYSASGPDMFALVNRVLQKFNEPEANTDWDSPSKLFPPFWTVDLENRYSGLFPMKIWGPGSQSYLAESRRSAGETLAERPSPELLSRELEDLHAGSWLFPSSPRSPPTYGVLKPSDPQNEDFALNQQPRTAPDGGYGKKQFDLFGRHHFSSQIWVQFYEEHQESIAGGVLGASGPEKPTQPSHSATEAVQDPAIQGDDLYAEGCTCESPQFMLPLTPPFQQGYGISEGENTEMHQTRQQHFPTFHDVTNKILVYHPRDSPYHMRPPPGFDHLYPPYSGDYCLQSGGLNPPGASCVIYQNPMPMYIPAHVSFGHGSITQPFGLQNRGVPSCRENLNPHNSFGGSPDDFQAPWQEHLGETPRNTSSRGQPRHPPPDTFAQRHGLGRAPNGGRAGQRTGQTERWTEPDALRGKKKPADVFGFTDPPFLPFYSTRGWSRFPKFSAFHPHPSWPGPPSSDDLPSGTPPLSGFVNDQPCRDASASYCVVSQHLPCKNNLWPAQTLYLHLEECYTQWRALERERTKMEADLATTLPEKYFTGSSEIKTLPRLPANATRVDRLVWVQFHERARVCTLIEKMETIWGIYIHGNILITLKCHLKAIRRTQARRNNEIFHSGNRQKPGRSSYISYDKDVLALALAVNELTFTTRRTRTALWCAFQHIVVSESVTSVPDENADENELQTDTQPSETNTETEENERED